MSQINKLPVNNHDILRLADFDKFETNPFVEKAIQEVKGHTVKKYKTASNTGEKAILQAVDDNGEILGHTSFIRQIEVDEDRFTKIYLSQFTAFFDLKTQGIRVFGYVMSKLIPKQDMFSFFMKEACEYTGYKGKESVYQGLAQLAAADIIARGPSDSHYFINPLVAFNGDRVTYAKTYVKKKKENNPNQLDIFKGKSHEEKDFQQLQEKLDRG